MIVRKILAGLAILAMLTVGVGSTLATPGKSENIPLLHKLAYKLTETDLEDAFHYVLDNGALNYMAYMFAGVLIVDKYFPKEDIQLTIEDFRNRGGLASFVLYLPYGEGRKLVLVEMFADGDTLVDAVLIREADDSMAVLRYIGEEIPSIYSSIYKKHMSNLIHKYVYPAPIKHAVINMGDE